MLLLLGPAVWTGQGATKVVGWPDTLDRKEVKKAFERLLAVQKNKTFGRRWFEEFEEAEREFAAAESRAAIHVAAKEAREAAELIHERVREDEFSDALRQVALALQITEQVRKSRDVIAAANHAAEVARWMKAWVEEDEDMEAISLLI